MVLSYSNRRSRERDDHLGSNRRFSHDAVMFCAEYGRGRQLGPWPVRRCPITGSSFKKRLVQVATAITANPQHSLPKACDDWADLKGAYRFLSNGRVEPDAIQEPHRQQTRGAPEQDPAVLQRAVPWLWILVVAGADKKNPVDPEKLTPREFWLRIARQGGYIGRKSDGRPGWSTIWKGWYDFMFMFQGAEFMAATQRSQKCG